MTSVLKAPAGRGISRGFSSPKTSTTRRLSFAPGHWRTIATSETQVDSWAFKSATPVKRRAAKNESRRYRIVRSTFPFSFPRYGAQGVGA